MLSTEHFWDFSVQTYRATGVPGACLALQNESGADVNMILLCCWIGATRGIVSDDLFEAALDFSRTWAGRVVRPLRGVRGWMKTDGCPDSRMAPDNCMELREKIKGVELEAEKLQQEVLEGLCTTGPEQTLNLSDQIDAAAKNLHRYCRAEEISLDDGDMGRLAVIISAAIDGADHKTALEALLA